KSPLFKRSLSYGVDLCVRIVPFLVTVPISIMIYLPVFSFFLLLPAVKFATSFIVFFFQLGYFSPFFFFNFYSFVIIFFFFYFFYFFYFIFFFFLIFIFLS